LRKQGESGYFTISNKVDGKIFMGEVSKNEICEIFQEGTVRKQEPDEETDGKYKKITLVWRNWYLVVKNTTPCFIITVGRN
jgi:hypothetical protein